MYQFQVVPAKGHGIVWCMFHLSPISKAWQDVLGSLCPGEELKLTGSGRYEAVDCDFEIQVKLHEVWLGGDQWISMEFMMIYVD